MTETESMEASEPDLGAVIVCNLDALTPSERDRRSEVARSIQDSALGMAESAEGFRVQLPNQPDICARALELVLLERRCCPFLSFELAFEPGEGAVTLEVGGPPGVKAFLRENGILGCAQPAAGTTCC
jgi:hypothetical protein